MDSEKLSGIIQVISICASIVTILGLIAGIIVLGVFLGRLTGGKADKKSRFLCLLPTVAAFLISAAGFVFNMGWYRFAMIVYFVPVWYTTLLVVSASASASIIKKSPLVRTCYILSHVFYVLSGLVMPDGGDYGPGYVFFGLINNYPRGLEYVAIALFAASIATMITQLVIAGRHKKALEQTETVTVTDQQKSE